MKNIILRFKSWLDQKMQPKHRIDEPHHLTHTKVRRVSSEEMEKRRKKRELKNKIGAKNQR